jgi:hypothetical protein
LLGCRRPQRGDECIDRTDGWNLVVLLLPLGLALVTLGVTVLAGGLRPINFVYLAPLPLIPLLLLHADLHRPS